MRDLVSVSRERGGLLEERGASTALAISSFQVLDIGYLAV